MTPTRGDAPLEVVKGPAHTPAPLPPPPAFEPEPGEEPSLAEYLAIVVDARWLVLAVLAAVLAAGAAYAVLAHRIYRTDVLLQVEENKGGLNGLGDLSSLFSDASPAETEIEIIRSRSVVGAAVDALRLDVVAAPARFPLLGDAVARHHHGDAPAGAWPGFGAWAWGGERIAVTRLDVPPALVGKALTLVAGPTGRYALRGPDGEALLDGEVGKAAAGGGVSLFVRELVARAGTRFTVKERARDVAVEDLQRELRIAEKGKKTGIVGMTLDGRDPRRIAAILDAIAQAYVRQNVDRGSAQAAQTLDFLEAQLPDVRKTLDAAEAALRDYQSKHGTVDLSLEAKAAVDRAADLEKAATELKLQRAELRQRFTDAHPAVVALDQKLAKLRNESAALEQQVRGMPGSEIEAARRMRDVKVSTELYMTLLNKMEELKVVKSGTIGTVRVLDGAIVPAEPVSPKTGVVLALSFLLGAALGLAAAFARHALTRGVEDPDELERTTSLAVYASIPHSAAQAQLARAGGKDGPPALVAMTDPKDVAVESLRSLRTSVQFALLEARNNVVAIGGPAPGVGKSFVAANLAHLLGEQGRRVLLVDADMRRGHLHRFFGRPRTPGLADVLRGAAPLEDAARASAAANVTLLPTGAIPPNPAELVGSDRFQRLLEQLAGKYDVVLVDTPPILAVTDAALVARHAGVNLLVLKAGVHPMREVQHALRSLARGGIRVQGLVLNDVRIERGILKKGAYHYQYEYE